MLRCASAAQPSQLTGPYPVLDKPRFLSVVKQASDSHPHVCAVSQGEAAAIALEGLRRQLEVANAKLRLLTAATEGDRMLSRRQSTEDFLPRAAPPGALPPPGRVAISEQVGEIWSGPCQSIG